MKVLLIHPNESAMEIIPASFEPLALELLAAHLTDDHDVAVMDMRFGDTDLATQLKTFAPDIVAVTCNFTAGVRIAQGLLSQVRTELPSATLVVGGVHASLQPGDFAYPFSDFVVRGTGERTLSELVATLERDEDSQSVAGLYVMSKKGIHFTGEKHKSYRWSEEYRFPARHLTEKYRHHYARSYRGKTITSVVTSRGCPHRCTFCSVWRLQRAGLLDTRRAESIVEEIASASGDCIYLADDNTFADRRVMDAIATELIAGQVKKDFQVWISTDLICKRVSLLEKWRSIGDLTLMSGFESVNNASLQSFNKRARTAQNSEALRICADLDIDLIATFIVDTNFGPDEFEQLSEYVDDRKMRPFFLLLTPLPGTELFANRAQDIREADPARYDLMHITIQPEKLPAESMIERFADLYLRNSVWRAGAERNPQAAQFLARVESLPQEPIYSSPVNGLDPKMTEFPFVTSVVGA